MLAHSRTGSGEPLILVHGVTHRREAWDTVTPYLEQEHEVIAVDLPGHGGSADVEPDFDGSSAPLVDAVEGLINDLGLERPHIAGNSLGGLIALEMAARGSVASATALSPAGFWSPVGRLWARGVLSGASKVLQALSPEQLDRVLAGTAGRVALTGLIIAHPGRQDPAVLSRDLQGLARPREGFAAMMAGLDRWTTPRRSDIPTMVAWGNRDYLLPRAQIRRLRGVLPDAHVVVLPDCGHIPMADDPALVAEVILGNARLARGRAWHTSTA
jgi:pimeloyl-ACP methyl ester carboxylesterase